MPQKKIMKKTSIVNNKEVEAK